MTCIFEQRYTRKVLALSIAAIGIAVGTPGAFADESTDEVASLINPDSQIELGVGGVSSNSYKFGDYTGLNKSGAYGIANISVVRHGSGDARYLEITGRNLGLNSRSLTVEGGQQGNYGLNLSYDELPKLWSDSYQTPFINPGSTRLMLPAGWVAANTTPGMTQLNASMHPFDIKTQRKSLGVGGSKELGGGWELVANYKEDKKDGNKLIGAVIGNSGGNPRATIIPQPIDYTTDQFKLLARYTTEKLQLQFGYYYSGFKDDNKALAWQNPYANAAGTTWGNAFVGYAGGGFGQLAEPPDNQFHQLSAIGGYALGPSTRLSGSLSFGRMTQNDAFLPYSINPNLTVTTPLPRSSLDGLINTTHADLRLTSRLTPKLGLIAFYRYDDKDNKTARNQYDYIGGDSQNQPALGGATTRWNTPSSSTKQQAGMDFDYRLTQTAKFKLGYDYDWARETYEAITDEHQNTAKAEIEQQFSDSASGGLAYSYSARRTSYYDGSAPYLASYDPATTGPAVAAGIGWDDLPGHMKYFLAPRNRDKLHAYVNAVPTDQVGLQFSLDANNDKYPDSSFGLTRAKSWQANFDANVVATDAVSGHVFASYEEYRTDQNSRQYTSANKAIILSQPQYNWSMADRDHTTTLGMGFNAKPTEKFDYGGELSHARSNGAISVVTASGLAAAAPLPDLTTRLTRLELFGHYLMQKNLTLNLRYAYERYSSYDWAYAQVLPSTLTAVIGTSEISPNYHVHMLGVSASYKFH